MQEEEDKRADIGSLLNKAEKDKTRQNIFKKKSMEKWEEKTVVRETKTVKGIIANKYGKGQKTENNRQKNRKGQKHRNLTEDYRDADLVIMRHKMSFESHNKSQET